MRYQKWNLSRITITTPTTIQIKCLLPSSQWNKELCTVHCNDTHTHTNWAVSVRKTSKQKNPSNGHRYMGEQQSLSQAPWISIQIPHLHRIYLDFIGEEKKKRIYTCLKMRRIVKWILKLGCEQEKTITHNSF